MKIIGFSISRPVTIAMLMTAMVLFGSIAFSRLPINLLPDITYPTLTVRTEYVGAAPNEIEKLVTEPIEEAVGVVTGVVRVSSISRPERSDVSLEFEWGTNMDFAGLNVREKIDLLNLPQTAEKPILLRFDPSLDPIVRLALSGDESLTTLRIMAEEEIKRELESLEGVAAVKVSGGLEEEIHVELDESKLASLGIPINQIATRLEQENVNIAGGTIKDSETEYLVRILNEFQTVEEIGDIIVGQVNTVPILLSDVAIVSKSHKERKLSARINGRDTIEISIYKEAGTNTIQVGRVVKERLGDIGETIRGLTAGVNLEIVFDQSVFIQQSVDEVLKTALYGGILAILVLYLFLRSSSSLIIGVSIPISIVTTFFFLYAFDVSLNIMSLGGLALGIGMLVDNSIVVLEGIDRHIKQGGDRKVTELVRLGASELGPAVIAATLTTVCVFVPIVFVEGIAGQLFRDLALAVTFSLTVATLVAVTLIPVISAFLHRVKEESKSEGEKSTLVQKPTTLLGKIGAWLSKGCSGIAKGLSYTLTGIFIVIRWIFLLVKVALQVILWIPSWMFDQILPVIQRGYPLFLRWALTHRLLTLTTGTGILVGSLYVVPSIGVELIPQMSQGEFFVNVRLPVGTPLPVTERVLKNMSNIAQEYPEISTVYSLAGAMGQAGGNAGEERENIGQLHIRLKTGIRGDLEEKVITSLRLDFESLPGLETPEFARPALFSFKNPVEIEVSGYNLTRLTEVSEELALQVSEVRGLTDVKASMEGGNPEVQILFDRRKLASLGLNLGSVTQIVQNKVQGNIATELTRRNRKIDIRVWAEDETRLSLDAVGRLVVNPEGSVPIPLSAVAEIRIARGPSEIRRVNQQRVAIVSAGLSDRSLGDVAADIQEVIDGFVLPIDFVVGIKGQNEEMQVAFASLQFAILLSFFLVYLVMASQFESLVHPFVIMFTFPFSIIGVVSMLIIASQTISVVVLIGVVMLTGIVVNNAIVLVDYINQLRRTGTDIQEAIIEASKTRLWPIMMTTATTVLGLLPMAIGVGEGAELRAPMAITVIGGLIAGTVVTLIFVPLIYMTIETILLTLNRTLTKVAGKLVTSD
tara:strand:+ start:4222 stop:7503 length:3282 start_codon:yes stop_codon:yes gene_type:complete